MKLWMTILGVLLISATALTQDLTPNVFYSDENGEVVEGIRCAMEQDYGPAHLPRAPGDMAQWKQQHGSALENTVVIPVAYHIITNSFGQGIPQMSQLEAQIDSLNSGYGDIGYQFYMAHVDTTANDTWYTVGFQSAAETQMKQALAIEPARTFNVYLANLGGGLLGWAWFPWSFPQGEDYFMHGAVILTASLPGGSAFPYNLGGTLVHEAGHYLGLYHTFQGGCVPPGDEVDDTPFQASSSSGCPIGRDSCPTQPGLDPIHNYMDYSDDACYEEFTPGQGDRVDWAVTNYRPSLLTAALIPSAPTEAFAYSDYTTPTSMQLSWLDPQTLVTGDTLGADFFHVMIARDGVLIDSVNSGLEAYSDTGLVDGQLYHYAIYARVDSNGASGDAAEVSWIAGGSPIPNGTSSFSLSGNESTIRFIWESPATNIDGTPMDDYAGINVYQNGIFLETIARTTADTGKVDTADYTVATPGFYDWHITIVDNEDPPNESEPTLPLGTPLALPLFDEFAEPGEPNPGIWINIDTDVNDRADNPPSGDYALNLNGKPNGEDMIDLKPLDLSGMETSGVLLRYHYQPQGSGNAPEPDDTLKVLFKNDLGEWILVKFYEGTTLQPFQEEIIDIAGAPAGDGSFFHGQFQVRFRSRGGAGFFPNDDWFIDDVRLGTEVVGIEDLAGEIPQQFAVSPNYPNPFNPSTSIRYQLPLTAKVSLVIYNTLGQRVRTLVDGTVSAGQHEAVWDGRNESGQAVASGVYIYRFESDYFKKVQKMLLVK